MHRTQKLSLFARFFQCLNLQPGNCDCLNIMEHNIATGPLVASCCAHCFVAFLEPDSRSKLMHRSSKSINFAINDVYQLINNISRFINDQLRRVMGDVRYWRGGAPQGPTRQYMYVTMALHPRLECKQSACVHRARRAGLHASVRLCARLHPYVVGVCLNLLANDQQLLSINYIHYFVI